MQLSNGEVFTLVLTAVGVIIWLVRLEGRVNLNERLLNDLTKHVEVVQKDVRYIRGRIDELVPRRRREDLDGYETDEDPGDDRRRG